MKKYIDLIKRLYLGALTPSRVSINLTNKCNQSCIYCEIGQGLNQPTKPLLSFDDVKWILDEMHKSKMYKLVLGGGEPLLFQGIFELIEYANKNGITPAILTNGMLLSQLSNDNIQILKKNNCIVNVSIDSFSAEKEEYIRGTKKALQLAEKGVETLIKHGINVNIMSVVSAYNYADLLDIVHNASRLGVNSVSFQPVVHISNFPEVEAISNKKRINILPEHLSIIEEQFGLIGNFEKNHNIKTNVNVLNHWISNYIRFVFSADSNDFFFSNVVKQFWCDPIYSTIFINYYGDILPCDMIHSDYSIKDRNGQTLLGLWDRATKKIREMVKSGQYPNSCKSCVCNFDSNVLCSVVKYPVSNRHLISKVLFGYLKDMVRRI